MIGADDGTGAAILQHVNQVAAYFNLNLFSGAYFTPSNVLHQGGSIFTSPEVVNPTEVSTTGTYAEVPHGLQPNGVYLATAIVGSPSTPLTGFGPLSPPA